MSETTGQELHTVGIAGTGRYLPEKILSNKDLEKLVETTDEWIFSRTGMRERRMAADDEATSDLCLKASRPALEQAGMEPSELDFIIVATVTPDYRLPSTAAILGELLGAKNAGGFDLNNACTGFLTAFMAARGMIASGVIKNALVVGAEVLSSIVDYEDRGSCILFGDGAGAMVLKADHPRGEILYTTSGMDGSQWDAINIPSGGSRIPETLATVQEKLNKMGVKGNDVFKFAVSKFRELIADSLESNGYGCDDLNLVVPHQVNSRIIESALKKLDIEMDRVYMNLEHYGNTSAASVPIAFDEVHRAGRLNEGDLISLVAFGAGLAWGSALVRW